MMRVVALWGCGLVVAGCVSTSEQMLVPLAEGCLLDSQCQQPLVCVFRRCHQKCEGDRDCPAGQKCAVTDNPYTVCLLADEATCKNGTCPGALVCSASQECLSGCSADTDCLPEQRCESLLCIDRARPDAGSVSNFCERSSDCPQGVGKDFCIGNRCRAQCVDDRDCPVGQACTQGACRAQGTTCRYNSECAVAERCSSQGQCVPECVADRDCGVGFSCAGSRCQANAPADAGLCRYNSECAVGSKCSAQGQCIPECVSDRDCNFGFECRMSQCALKMAVADGGSDAGAVAVVDAGRPCTFNSQCLPTERCSPQGQCVPECLADRDCNQNLGQCCRGNSCVAGVACLPDAGVVDGGSGASDGGVGTVMIGGACSFDGQCTDGDACNGTETCTNRVCASAARSFCDDGNPCTIDVCSSASGGASCSYATQNIDADNDGHFPSSCGGTADDCDDGDGFTFPNAPEKCDFKDNDCDGLIDEERWQQETVPSAFSVGGKYPAVVGPPAVEVVNGEVVVVAAGFDSTGAYESYRLSATDLSLIAGPTVLDQVTTAWTSCFTTSAFSSADLWRPSLAPTTSGTQAMLSGLLINRSSSQMVCCNNSGEQLTHRNAGTVFGAAGVLGRGAFTSVQRTGAALNPVCDHSYAASPSPSLPVMPATVAWSDRLQRWVGAWWGNRSGVNGSPPDLVFNTVGLDGGAGVERVVSTTARIGFMASGVVRTAVAVSPTRVLFAWSSAAVAGTSVNHVAFSLYDADLLGQLGPVYRVPLSSNVQHVEAARFDGTRFVIDVRLDDSLVQLVVDEAGASSLRVITPSVTSAFSGSRNTLNAGASTVLWPQGGMTVAYKDFGPESLRLAFGLNQRPDGGSVIDGGFEYLDVPMATVAQMDERSGYRLVPLTPSTGRPYRAGVVWTDQGDLRRMIVSCVSQ